MRWTANIDDSVSHKHCQLFEALQENSEMFNNVRKIV